MSSMRRMCLLPPPARSARSNPRSLAAASHALVAVLLLLLLLLGGVVAEAKLLSVDFGSSGIKAARHVTGDDIFAIVLSAQSARKIPPCVALHTSSSTPDNCTIVHDPEADAAGWVRCDGDAVTTETERPERLLGETAAALSLRFPQRVVCAPHRLLGVRYDDVLAARVATNADEDEAKAAATAYRSNLRFAAAMLGSGTIGRRAGRGSVEVTLQTPTGATDALSAEEVTGMLLGYVKLLAEGGLHRRVQRGMATAQSHDMVEPLRYAVMTVPFEASVAHRQALVDSAALAGLRTLRLVHSTTAAAVLLAHRQRNSLFAEGAAPIGRLVMILDCGSAHTEAAVYGYRIAAVGFQNHPEGQPRERVELLGYATDWTLGGDSFDTCLAAAIHERFVEAKQSALQQRTDAFGGNATVRYVSAVAMVHASTSPDDAAVWEAMDGEAQRLVRKAASALLRAVNHLRESLSANRDAFLSVDEMVVIEVHGAAHPVTVFRSAFSTKVTRAHFEDTCSDLFVRAVTVRDAALAHASARIMSHAGDTGPAELRMSDLDRFEVVGGAARMPHLLQLLSSGYPGSATATATTSGGGGRGGGSSHITVGRTLDGDEAAAFGASHLTAAVDLGYAGFPSLDLAEPLVSSVSVAYARHPAGSGCNVPGTTWSTPVEVFARETVTLPAERLVHLSTRSQDDRLVVVLADPTPVATIDSPFSAFRFRVPYCIHGVHASDADGVRYAITINVAVGESGIPVIASAWQESSEFEQGANDTAGSARELSVTRLRRSEAAGVTMGHDEAVASAAVLAEWQRIDDIRYVHRSARNDLEATLLHLRSERPVGGAAPPLLDDAERWFRDHSEHATIHQLTTWRKRLVTPPGDDTTAVAAAVSEVE